MTHFALLASLCLAREVEKTVISALSNGYGRFVVAGAESGISLAAPPHCTTYTNMDAFTFTWTGFESDMGDTKDKIYGSFD